MNKLTLIICFCLIFLSSCGKSDIDHDDDDYAYAALNVDFASANLDYYTQYIAVISFQVINGMGETIFQKSVPRNEMVNFLKEGITGIKETENATLVAYVFLGSDVTMPKLNKCAQ